MSPAGRQGEEGPPERLARWTGGYRPQPGLPDEFMAADGAMRGAWPRLLERLGDLGEAEIMARFVSAERHIRDTGISFRIYGDQREHAWPLGSLPLVIEADEWRTLSEGLVQRAELMEAILADVYGPAGLVSAGLLPASVVAGSPEFLRPLHGVSPPGGRYLKLYAADIGRAPDGRWRVLADRTQAPSGLGYALENRMVLSRTYPDLYQDLHVERLPPFFQSFREGLAAGAERADPRICLLTSGPYSSTYVEQAALARYLGLMLVEGDDLVMQDGCLQVRTVSGLKRADALWRRIDGDYLDPIELNPASRLGVPGLIEALRNGSLVMANMPGSGMVESGALAAYLPGIARALLGEDLRLESPRTWWCGDPDGLAYVRDHLDDLTLRPAATPQRGAGRDAILGPHALAADRAQVVAALRDRPFDYVGQEPAPLSTMPGWERTESGLRFVPRPFALRVFAARTPQGWRVMPGGFCRISERPDVDPIEMRLGIKSADVWILSGSPVDAPTLAVQGAPRVRRIAGHLPSRAADTLFWYGRYTERAEAVIRLVLAHLGSVGDAVVTDITGDVRAPTALRIRAILDEWGAVSAPDLPTAAMAQEALVGRESRGSARAHILSARTNAATLRTRLSGEAWRVLADLVDLLSLDQARDFAESQLLRRAERALSHIAALSGLTHENMSRAAGWHFVDLGRRIERAINTCSFAMAFAGDEASADDLGVMLALCDSQVTYGARYMQGVALDPVRDMVLLDPYNPRSVAFQVEAVLRHLADLPALSADGIPEPQRRLASRIAAEFSAGEAGDFDGVAMARLESELERLADAVAGRYFPNGPHALRPEKLAGLA
ncbi:circularly permuted type 2 ATP-grasp protein [Methylobacterium planeticum]|uniref:Circularly permuted type 2 ATP-grasp protein n=1 Tax=Methylobacterium planeticum TaxID=2615211 RepID=A0A6N6MPI6_9HYPH|nr:circularly permuted type 2 ATP-grasp protein [Methylobacterium planeticum]KAB1073265.1 circularly permuted type 2 ATP-grasp protein [Methylobacterium planeticum]